MRMLKYSTLDKERISIDDINHIFWLAVIAIALFLAQRKGRGVEMYEYQPARRPERRIQNGVQADVARNPASNAFLYGRLQ